MKDEEKSRLRGMAAYDKLEDPDESLSEEEALRRFVKTVEGLE